MLKLQPKPFFFIFRYQAALKTDKYKDIDADFAVEFNDFFQKYECGLSASDTWFDMSVKGYYEYEECEGDQLLGWGSRGYATILDLLMVLYCLY